MNPERMMIIRLIIQLQWMRDFMKYKSVMPTEIEPYINSVIEEARMSVNWVKGNESEKETNPRRQMGS